MWSQIELKTSVFVRSSPRSHNPGGRRDGIDEARSQRCDTFRGRTEGGAFFLFPCRDVNAPDRWRSPKGDRKRHRRRATMFPLDFRAVM